MEYNFSGIAINKNFEDNIIDLQNDLGLKLDYIGKLSANNVFDKYIDEDSAYILFHKRATLILLHPNLIKKDYFIRIRKTLTFSFNQSQNNIYLKFFDSKYPKRTLDIVGGNKQVDEGSEFYFENECETQQDIFWRKLQDILGYNIQKLDSDSLFSKYSVEQLTEELEDENSSEWNYLEEYTNQETTYDYSQTETSEKEYQQVEAYSNQTNDYTNQEAEDVDFKSGSTDKYIELYSRYTREQLINEVENLFELPDMHKNEDYYQRLSAIQVISKNRSLDLFEEENEHEEYKEEKSGPSFWSVIIGILILVKIIIIISRCN